MILMKMCKKSGMILEQSQSQSPQNEEETANTTWWLKGFFHVLLFEF